MGGRGSSRGKGSYFLKVYFSKVYCKYANILGPNFFDPKDTQPKLFETERTRRLAHLPSFCELVAYWLWIMKTKMESEIHTATDSA